jgi:hypothetical protein
MMMMRIVAIALALVVVAFLGHSARAQATQPLRPSVDCFWKTRPASLPNLVCPPGTPGAKWTGPGAGNANAGIATVSPAIISELYQRYKSRLPTLTRAEIEKIWVTQSHSRAWFQSTYALLDRGRDNPQLIDKLRSEVPCAETNRLSREITFSPAAKQFRCTMNFTVANTHAEVVLYLNFESGGTLESAVIYQTVPLKVVAEQAASPQTEGFLKNDFPVLVELHSDIMSRIDNARAPPGGYAEYSKNMEREKFAVRFR